MLVINDFSAAADEMDPHPKGRTATTAKGKAVGDDTHRTRTVAPTTNAVSRGFAGGSVGRQDRRTAALQHRLPLDTSWRFLNKSFNLSGAGTTAVLGAFLTNSVADEPRLLAPSNTADSEGGDPIGRRAGQLDLDAIAARSIVLNALPPLSSRSEGYAVRDARSNVSRQTVTSVDRQSGRSIDELRTPASTLTTTLEPLPNLVPRWPLQPPTQGPGADIRSNPLTGRAGRATRGDVGNRRPRAAVPNRATERPPARTLSPLHTLGQLNDRAFGMHHAARDLHNPPLVDGEKLLPLSAPESSLQAWIECRRSAGETATAAQAHPPSAQQGTPQPVTPRQAPSRSSLRSRHSTSSDHGALHELQDLVDGCIKAMYDFAPLVPGERMPAHEDVSVLVDLRGRVATDHPIDGGHVRLASLVPRELHGNAKAQPAVAADGARRTGQSTATNARALTLFTVTTGDDDVADGHEGISASHYGAALAHSATANARDCFRIPRTELVDPAMPSDHEQRLEWLWQRQHEAEIYFGLRSARV